jgi:hypothetical protein
MAASAEVRVFHGSSPTGTAVTEVRYKRADNSTVDLLTQLQIPSAGVVRSWPKHFKVVFTTSPSVQISNLRWYLAARPSAWDGVSIWAGVTASYAQAVVTDENAIRPGLIDGDVYTSASPLMIAAGIVLSNPNTGDGGTAQSYLQAQATMNALVTPGVKAPRPSYYRYDEA